MKYLTPVPKQFVDQSGVPYSGGKVSVYVTGSTDFAEIYLDADGETLAPNPARLDSNGSWICFVSPDQVLDYVVQDEDNHVVATYEKVVVGGGSGEGGNYTAGEGINIQRNTISLDYLTVNSEGEVCLSYYED